MPAGGARLHKRGCAPDPAKPGAPRMRKGAMTVLVLCSAMGAAVSAGHVPISRPARHCNIYIQTLIFPARALRLSRLLHAKCLNGRGEIAGDGTGVAIALGVSGGGALSIEPVYLARNLGN
jgi:hypothetical protein